jgi:hypothetical protein
MQNFLLRHIYIYLFLRQKRGIYRKDQRERDTSSHKAKKISSLGLSKNKNELTLLNPYPSNNKKTVEDKTN